MPTQTRVLSPGPTPTSFRAPDGQVLTPPKDWACLPPGDAGLTRRVKAAGPTWTVQEKVGRKMFSRGVWAPAATIAAARAALDAERATPQYAKKQAAAAVRRDREQTEYVGTFRDAVLAFLNFHASHAALADKLATAVTAHATPVGSGTVARTERIPVEERARAAVIAWMRHQTTAYDDMRIARIKGERRAVRRELAERSVRVLEGYRAGRPAAGACPLAKALG
ncbi:MAG TPA: DUF2293 domain-containing protein [Tepidisphaeraceae bacterium]|nr:DUF2293 domain-containing protein [Tepidisphaeraceae bacterium]